MVLGRLEKATKVTSEASMMLADVMFRKVGILRPFFFFHNLCSPLAE